MIPLLASWTAGCAQPPLPSARPPAARAVAETCPSLATPFPGAPILAEHVLLAFDNDRDVLAEDLDGDDDLDLLVSWYRTIAWLENLGGGTFGPAQVLGEDYGVLAAADLDGDGDLDAIVQDEHYEMTPTWYENLGGTFTAATTDLPAGPANIRAMAAGDLDGDGDADLVAGFTTDDTVGWYENLGGGSFAAPVYLDTALEWVESVAIADLDGDGHEEVIAAGSEVAVYQGFGGGTFGRRLLPGAVVNARHIEVLDMNADGSLDLLVTGLHASFLHIGHDGEFTTPLRIPGNHDSGISADLDGDGLRELIVTLDDATAWLPNLGGRFDPDTAVPLPWGQHTVMVAADLDSDGDDEVVGLPNVDDILDTELTVLEGAGSDLADDDGDGVCDADDACAAADDRHDEDGDGVPNACDTCMLAGDADHDGSPDDCDLCPGAPDSDDRDGDGAPDACDACPDDVLGDTDGDGTCDADDLCPGGIDGADADGDGTPDACDPCPLARGDDLDADGLCDNIDDTDGDGVVDDLDECRTLANPDQGWFGSPVDVAAGVEVAVYSVDVDLDGDLDVLTSERSPNEIAWVENLGGGTFAPRRVVATVPDGLGKVVPADLDADGDADAVYDALGDLGWVENLGGGSFGAPEVLVPGAAWIGHVLATDLDDDGDIDLAWTTGSQVRWAANQGGATFGPRSVAATPPAPVAEVLAAGDVDVDGDRDLVLGDTQGIRWVENTGSGFSGVARDLSTDLHTTTELAFADMDGDGDDDLLVVGVGAGGSEVAWLEASGGAWGPMRTVTVLLSVAHAVPLDREGDGDLDLVVVADDDLWGVENLGGGVFAGPWPWTLGSGLASANIEHIDAADMDADGDLDLLLPWEDAMATRWLPNVPRAADSDGDGVCDADALFDADGDGWSPFDGDCDDSDAGTLPGAAERCDGLDNDCDGAVPADEQDLDGDGIASCDGDCDEGDVLVAPGEPEGCDGIDTDCDGLPSPQETDGDGDGIAACAGDCDDTDSTRHPGADEACNGVDDDCDGTLPADEEDLDGDGITACEGDSMEEDGPPCGCGAAPLPGAAWVLALVPWICRRRAV